MKLPIRFVARLEQDAKLYSLVQEAIRCFEPWVRNSQIPFFPEYTDHGIDHLECVLQTSCDLISDEAASVITGEDIAVLVLAILLHDCATHLTEDGFSSLLRDKQIWAGVAEFEGKSWLQLWEEFLTEASRFDERKLLALFGDSDPIRRPDTKTLNFDRRDRFLIGEFIRRHHARLAHEIALSGIPGSGAPVQFVNDAYIKSSGVADLAGLIARSHGLPLRNCIDYLKSKYDLRTYQNIHAVFLMVLLRIADFLQIQSQRAPIDTLAVRRLRSPISQGEWRVHHCIRNITATEDPEAVFIDAQPTDVKTYLRVREWLSGLQEELDTSWAVLGEVYGRYQREKLDKLGLRLRRVRSSLDDFDRFAARAPYVPTKASFGTAHADLLKLLVGPLYGNEPHYGFRELLQNSVDAVRELADLAERDPELKTREFLETDPSSDVELIIELGDDDLPVAAEIRDRGIGMTAEVICKFFLTAGASYRASDSWKQLHELDGKSRVLRSGRFGIGALAAFLIGDEIEVRTRHVHAAKDRGIAFRAALGSDAIELRWVECPIGTSIRIQIPPHRRQLVTDMLVKQQRFNGITTDAWDLYCLAWPRVLRRVLTKGGKGFKLPQSCNLPAEKEEAQAPWRTLRAKDFNKVFWSYSDKAPELVCNGIIVNGYGFRRYSFLGHSYEAFERNTAAPNLCVFDANGKLPLNLQRSGLASPLPFREELLKGVIEDIIAYALVTAPVKPISDGEVSDWYRGKHPGFIQFTHPIGSWYFWANLKDGIAYLDLPLLIHLGVRKLLLFVNLSSNGKSTISRIGDGTTSFISGNVALGGVGEIPVSNKQDAVARVRALFNATTLDEPLNDYGTITPLKSSLITGRRLFFSDTLKKVLAENSYMPNYLTAALETAKRVAPGWWCHADPSPQVEGDVDYKALFKRSTKSENQPQLFCELMLANQSECPATILSRKWLEVLNGPVPLSRRDRQEIRLRQKDVLGQYLTMYEPD